MVLSTRRITALDVAAFGLFVFAILPLSTEAVQPLSGKYQPNAIDLTMPAKLTVLKSVVLSGNAEDAYQKWVTDRGHFGAFAVGEAGAYGWSDNHFTAEYASQSAMEFCGEDSSGCEVIATLGYADQPANDVVVLSPKAAESFRDYMDRPGAKAFAITDWGSYGWAWSHTSLNAAKAGAVKYCRANLAKAKRRGLARGVKCKVISATRGVEINPTDVVR